MENVLGVGSHIDSMRYGNGGFGIYLFSAMAFLAAQADAQPREYVLLHEGTQVLTITLRNQVSGKAQGTLNIAGNSSPFEATINAGRISFTTKMPDGTSVRWSGSITPERFTATLSDQTGSQAYTLEARGLGWSSVSQLAKSWAEQLTGRFISTAERSGGGSSGSASRDMSVAFCENGKALYQERFVLSVTVPGMGGGQTSRSEEAARWRVISRGNIAALEIVTKAGEAFQLRLQEGSPGVIRLAEQSIRLGSARDKCSHPALR